MSKLFIADLPRIIKSKLFYILIALCIVVPMISVIANGLDMEDKSQLFMITSSEICVNMTSLMPLFAGLFSAILIGKEFTKGVIRNKILVSKKRSSILIEWIIIHTIITLIFFMVILGSFALSILIMGGNFKGIDGKTLSLNLLIVLLYFIKFQLFSILVMTILPDEKMAVVLLVFNILIMIPFALLQSINGIAKAMSYISRVSYIGFVNQENFSLLVSPEKAWLSIIIIVAMCVGYLIAAFKIFNKKDIK